MINDLSNVEKAANVLKFFEKYCGDGSALFLVIKTQYDQIAPSDNKEQTAKNFLRLTDENKLRLVDIIGAKDSIKELQTAGILGDHAQLSETFDKLETKFIKNEFSEQEVGAVSNIIRKTNKL